MRNEAGVKNNSELISAVVTSYNHAEYLDQRMESLLNQTCPNLEIVVVDDCSTDGSADVLTKYRKLPNVTIVLLEQNQGYANTSNLGVSLCRGEYIIFAECDDYSEPEQIELLYAALSRNDSAAVAFSKSTMVDEAGRITGDDFAFREPEFRQLCSSDALIEAKLMRRFLMFSCVIPNMSAAMFRKRSFDRIGGFSASFKACADWDFWCRMAEEDDFFYVTRPLNNFRSHSTTVRNTYNISMYLSEIYEITFKAYCNSNLKFSDRIRFKYNMGVIWASYLSAPLGWLAALPRVWLLTLKYEPLLIIFMFYAASIKVAFNLTKFYRRVGCTKVTSENH